MALASGGCVQKETREFPCAGHSTLNNPKFAPGKNVKSAALAALHISTSSCCYSCCCCCCCCCCRHLLPPAAESPSRRDRCPSLETPDLQRTYQNRRSLEPVAEARNSSNNIKHGCSRQVNPGCRKITIWNGGSSSSYYKTCLSQCTLERTDFERTSWLFIVSYPAGFYLEHGPEPVLMNSTATEVHMHTPVTT